jgi:Icc protein
MPEGERKNIPFHNADRKWKAFMATDKSISKTLLIVSLLFLGFIVFVHLSGVSYSLAKEKDSYHLVILGDPHLPGRNISEKENVIKTINSWDDVDRVVALGDICSELGTTNELKYAKEFFSQLQKPLLVIAGNHDYVYDDYLNSQGKIKRGSSGSQHHKLQRFAKTFNLPNLYYSKKLGDYLLIFLSTDELNSHELARISKRQMDWWRSELLRNKELPTVVFFHAPLGGTLKNHNKKTNMPSFVAQPEESIRQLILKNSQIFLWVSGHTHTPATNENYASEINVYEGRVTNIHNCDMNRLTIWTNSLYLYSDKVLVKTFNHKKGGWMEGLERTIIPQKTRVEGSKANP